MKKKIVAVIGARPQFIKHAPIELVFKEAINLITIHTGQHYDKNMSDIFFDELKLEKPKYQFSSGGGAHGEQTGKMLIEIEQVLQKENPEACLVYGDTNSTLAGGLAASKLNIPVIHIEAGLRSFNKSMPEEINRIAVDHMSSLLFCPNDNALQNLARENIINNVFVTGDIMADMLRIAQNRITLKSEPFVYATIHRPYNTDNPQRLGKLFSTLNNLPDLVIFSLHPRTKKLAIDNSMDLSIFKNIKFMDPVGYFDNVNYIANSLLTITDSGGIQKEAYILKTKCITIRSETEWVETLENNWNNLVYEKMDEIEDFYHAKVGAHNENLYGDGHAAERILDIVLQHLK